MKDRDKTKEELVRELQELKQKYDSLQSSYEKIPIEVRSDEEMILKLSKAVDTTSDAIFLTDIEGIITYINSGFTALFGYTADEIVGKVTPRIIKSGLLDKEVYENFWKTLLNKAEVKGEILNKRKNGELVLVESTSSPVLNEKNAIIGFIGIQRDITERKQTEELIIANKELLFQNEEKEKRAAALIIAKEKAEESDRLKSAFLANISHEIRTPMNGIMGFSELLKEPHLTSEEQKEYIELIAMSSTRMLNIITDIVNISKIEAGAMKVSISETNVNEQIKNVYNSFKSEAELKGIQFLVKTALSSKESIIKTDREKLYSILTSLVNNAIKFTHAGSIEFGIEKKGKYLEFFVKDTGDGIADEKKEIIFKRFRQGSESHTRKYEGAGLGLSISKAYVDMLGGNIWVETELGKGSIFYFTIPYNAETESEIVIKDVSSGIVADDKAKNLKILIVEDDETSESFLSVVVKKYCKEIYKACNGTKAVEICRNNPDIDLVLMDVRMPEMNG